MEPRSHDAASSVEPPLILWLDEITESHLGLVGHKSINLARVRSMNSASGTIRVPNGFVLTTELTAQVVGQVGSNRTPDGSTLPSSIRDVISAAFELLRSGSGSAEDFRVAVRSNAVGEDSLGASYAGQFMSVLDVRNVDDLATAYLDVLASTLNPRVDAYRKAIGGETGGPTMSVLVQQMIRSDVGVAGVMLTSTADPSQREAEQSGPGDTQAIVIEAVKGTGESLVGGAVQPERHVLSRAKSSSGVLRRVSVSTGTPESVGEVLDSATARRLGEWGMALQAEFASPVEVEWALDGLTAELAVVQVRPHQADFFNLRGSGEVRDADRWAGVSRYARLRPVLKGLAIGTATVTGTAVVASDPDELLEMADLDALPEDLVLVVPTTSPEWVPLMAMATALVTDVGGLGSHAAIVCRELGLPAVLGCGEATTTLAGDDPSRAGTEPDPKGSEATGWGTEVVVDCSEAPIGRVFA